MIKNPVTRPLTSQKRGLLLARKVYLLRQGALLAEAFAAGELRDMLARLRQRQNEIDKAVSRE